MFLAFEWNELKSSVEIVNQYIVDGENNAHYDCIDLLLTRLLKAGSLWQVQTAFLLLSVVAESSELTAVRVVSKFAYKEEATATTSKLIHDFFMEVELEIGREETLPLMEEKMFAMFSLLGNGVGRWRMRDIVVELVFCAKESLIAFCFRLLDKAFQHVNAPVPQTAIVLILQFFAIVGISEKSYTNSISNFASMFDKCPPLIQSLLAHSALFAKLPRQPKDASLLTPELFLTLYKDLSKHSDSALLFLHRFHQPFEQLLPAYVSLQTSLPKRQALVAAPTAAANKEEMRVWKRRLEAEKEERRKSVEALSVGIMQVEGEVQALRYESITSRSVAATLKKVLRILSN